MHVVRKVLLVTRESEAWQVSKDIMDFRDCLVLLVITENKVPLVLLVLLAPGVLLVLLVLLEKMVAMVCLDLLGLLVCVDLRVAKDHLVQQAHPVFLAHLVPMVVAMKLAMMQNTIVQISHLLDPRIMKLMPL